MTSLARHQLWTKITTQLQVGDTGFLTSLRTNSGNTQNSERLLIARIRDSLSDMGLTFQEAGSQQSRDFRDVGGIGLDIEVKKTDSFTIYFNDTCPSSNIYYITVFTGKTYKTKPDIPPKIIYCNGSEFIQDSPWIQEYQQAIDKLKDQYARGAGRKNLSGIMEVYPRPTYKANISKFILVPDH